MIPDLINLMSTRFWQWLARVVVDMCGGHIHQPPCCPRGSAEHPKWCPKYPSLTWMGIVPEFDQQGCVHPYPFCLGMTSPGHNKFKSCSFLVFKNLCFPGFQGSTQKELSFLCPHAVYVALSRLFDGYVGGSEDHRSVSVICWASLFCST